MFWSPRTIAARLDIALTICDGVRQTAYPSAPVTRGDTG